MSPGACRSRETRRDSLGTLGRTMARSSMDIKVEYPEYIPSESKQAGGMVSGDSILKFIRLCSEDSEDRIGTDAFELARCSRQVAETPYERR